MAPAAGAPVLPITLARLLRPDAPDTARLISVWSLEEDRDRLLDYASARAADAPPHPPEPEPAGRPADLDGVASLAATAPITDLVQRQTAVLLPDRPGRGPGALRPLFRELWFSAVALEAGSGLPGAASADPTLFRHLATRLDGRMLPALRASLGRGGVLDALAPGAPPLHINLALPGILSQDFAALAAACREAGVSLGVELSFMEACADPAAAAEARSVVARAGMQLALDGVSHLGLLLTRPERLAPDILKLDWSPLLPELPEADRARLADALTRLGPERVVLHRAASEAALRWGLAHGIRRFQGRHVDAMLAAARLLACPQAAGCTLPQCMERSLATGAAARRSCGNLALLDAGAPL
jgi:hypothetical protein